MCIQSCPRLEKCDKLQSVIMESSISICNDTKSVFFLLSVPYMDAHFMTVGLSVVFSLSVGQPCAFRDYA